MGKYLIIKELESNGTLKKALKEGLISPSIIVHKKIYENYLLNKQKITSKMKLYRETADHFNISVRQVIRIVNDLQ